MKPMITPDTAYLQNIKDTSTYEEDCMEVGLSHYISPCNRTGNDLENNQVVNKDSIEQPSQNLLQHLAIVNFVA